MNGYWPCWFLRTMSSCPEGGYSQKNRGCGCAARFPKPLPYLWPKSAVFPTLFMSWLWNLNPVFNQPYNNFPSSDHLAYGWRTGNLNWPIRIQQGWKNLVSSHQCKLTGKALKSGNFSHWRWHEIFTKGDLQFQKPYHIAKSEKNETFCVFSF